jgi:hypothetical protein
LVIQDGAALGGMGSPSGVRSSSRRSGAFSSCRREVEFVAMERLLALQWAILDRHFQYHIRLVGHFREIGPAAVLRMWRTQTNNDGKPLSQFEHDALKERYCELFGTWPE